MSETLELRQRIMAVIAERPRQFWMLHEAVGGHRVHHFRVVDRELQKLRRAGYIAYDRAERVWRASSGGEQNR